MNSRRISFFREVLQGLCLVLLIVVPGLLYARTLAFDFVNWDDSLYVYANPAIRAFTLANIQSWFLHPFAALYVPVPMASYALNYLASGLDPGSFHAWNLVLHVLNTFLVFLIFYFFHRDVYLCFLGALIFAVHPVQVESVVWISQRKNLLFAFFFLSGFYAVLHSFFSEPKRRSLMAIAVFCFVLSVLSKATAVMIPFVLLAFDVFYRGTSKRQSLLPVLFLLIPALAMGAFTLLLYPDAVHSFQLTRFLERFAHWPAVLFFYLRLALKPDFLDLNYQDAVLLPEVPGIWGWAALAGVLLLALLFLLSLKKVRTGFWMLWFILFLLPVANLLYVPMGDRHLYVPLIGLIGLVLMTAKFSRLGVLVLLGAWAVYLIPFTHQRINVWENSETLWKSVKVKGPFRFTADMQLAGYYEDQGRFEEAASLYREIMTRSPVLPYPYINAYNLYIRLGQEDKAREIAVLFSEGYTEAHSLEEVYRKLLTLKKDPAQVEAYLNEVIAANRYHANQERTRIL